MSRSEEKRQRMIQKFLGVKNNAGDKVNPLTAGWMFNSWYEKLILVVLMILGIWKLGGLIF